MRILECMGFRREMIKEFQRQGCEGFSSFPASAAADQLKKTERTVSPQQPAPMKQKGIGKFVMAFRFMRGGAQKITAKP